MNARLTRNGIGVAAAAAVLIAAAVGLGHRELLCLGLIALAALLVALLWLTDEPAVTVVRVIPEPRVAEGEKVAVELHVTNVGRRRSPPLTAIESYDGRFVRVVVPSLRVGVQPHTGLYRLPASRRGVHPLTLTVNAADPLRLVERTVAVAEPGVIYVHPRRFRTLPLPVGQAADGDGPVHGLPTPDAAEFDTLREKRQDDDVRHIHWRTTARTGKLMVRQDASASAPSTRIVLDTRAGPYLDGGRFELVWFDEAVRIVASLVEAGVAAGHPVALGTTEPHRELPAPIEADGGEVPFEVLDWLADTQVELDGERPTPDPVLPEEHRVDVLGMVTGVLDGRTAAVLARARDSRAAVTVVVVAPESSGGVELVPGVMVLTVNDLPGFVSEPAVPVG